MSARSVTSVQQQQRKKKLRASHNQFITQCVNWFVKNLQEHAARMPKIFVNDEQFPTETPSEPNQSHVHLTISNEGSLRVLKYRLNFLEDEDLLNLQQLLPSYHFLTELRFEFCSLTYDQILFIHLILQEHRQIVFLSLTGNPKIGHDDDVHHLPLQETHLKAYNAQLCKLDAHNAQLFFCDALHKPSKYTRYLVSLNLGCNQLEDEGCEYIGEFLRSNRTLQALNISENYISENGLINFFEVFGCFELNEEEVRFKRHLRLAALLKIYFKDAKKDSILSMSTNDTVNTIISDSSILCNQHPFVIDSFKQDGKLLCSGNNALLHLNIAYNRITSKVLEELLVKIKYQKQTFKGGGLQRVIAESYNKFPDLMHEINKVLSSSVPQRAQKRASSAN